MRSNTNAALKAAIAELSPIHGGETAAVAAVEYIRETVVLLDKFAKPPTIALMLRCLGVATPAVATAAAQTLFDDVRVAP